MPRPDCSLPVKIAKRPPFLADSNIVVCTNQRCVVKRTALVGSARVSQLVGVGLPFALLPQAVRVAGELDDMGLMGKAVKQGQGQAFIAKNLGRGPSGRGKLEIGGDDQGNPFIEGGAELEEQLCAERRKRNKAEFIKDK